MSQLDIQKVPEPDDRTLPIFKELNEIADRIRIHAYNLFSRRGGGDGHALDDWLAAEHELCWPAAEFVETDEKFEISVALAGFKPSEITLTATPREIIVKATHEQAKKGESEEGAAKLRWSEFHANDVLRRVDLPRSVDVDMVTADLQNGLLTITAPIAESKKSERKKVEISTTS